MAKKKAVEFNRKQKRALRNALNFRNPVLEILFGGAAGGGKSFVGSYFILYMALKFDGVRLVLGRSRLKTLKQTTFVTFQEVLRREGLEEGLHFKIDNQKNEVHFNNGSVVILIDLFLFPTDKDFDRLGGLEITAAFVDEVNQVAQKGIEVLLSRMRWKLLEFCDVCGSSTEKMKVTKYDFNKEPIQWYCHKCKDTTEGLKPKLLMSCNPSNGWVKSRYYRPTVEGTITPEKLFVPANAGDNTKLPASYIEILKGLSKNSRERLLLGNWETESKDALFKSHSIDSLFNTEKEPNKEGVNKIAIDPAGTGEDAAEIIVITENKCVVEWVTLPECKKPSVIIEEVERLQKKYNVSMYDISYDVDGLGWGLNDAFEYGVQINNGGTPDDKIYQNRKAELYFKLSREIEEGNISINCHTLEIETELMEELSVIEEVDIDKDGRRKITQKQDIKAAIGRSPNKADVLAYAMVFFMDETNSEYFTM